jgi:hypothetical protein
MKGTYGPVAISAMHAKSILVSHLKYPLVTFSALHHGEGAHTLNQW